MNSTARKPACAASPKRSRKGTSLNMNDKLAQKRGMRRGSAHGVTCRVVQFRSDDASGRLESTFD